MILKYICPDCGKQITLNVTTIDKLQDEIKAMREDYARLKQQLDKYINTNNHADMGWFFDMINKGEKWK